MAQLTPLYSDLQQSLHFSCVVPEEGPCAIVVLDNASWHEVKQLNSHNFQPEFLQYTYSFTLFKVHNTL